METHITRAIIDAYLRKLSDHLSVDVAVVGAGPSGLVAAGALARQGFRVAVFERQLAPGGGVWGGGMLFNEVAVESDVVPILEAFGIRAKPSGSELLTVDSVELASGLIFGAIQSGATVFNAITVDDVVVREDRVCGLVVNWSPVIRLQMHVDPVCVSARAVLDATGHQSEVVRLATTKGRIQLATESGGLAGERSMWAKRGEADTVRCTGRVAPGLYVSGMAACQVFGGFRMGPVFGGMLQSGRKVASLIAADLRAEGESQSTQDSPRNSAAM